MSRALPPLRRCPPCVAPRALPSPKPLHPSPKPHALNPSHCPHPDTQVYYIDPEKGADTNSGLTPQKPFKTLRKAWGLIPERTTLTKGFHFKISSGTLTPAMLPFYATNNRGNYWWGKWGTYKAPIILESVDGPGKVTIDGAYLYDVRWGAGEAGLGLAVRVRHAVNVSWGGAAGGKAGPSCRRPSAHTPPLVRPPSSPLAQARLLLGPALQGHHRAGADRADGPVRGRGQRVDERVRRAAPPVQQRSAALLGAAPRPSRPLLPCT